MFNMAVRKLRDTLGTNAYRLPVSLFITTYDNIDRGWPGAFKGGSFKIMLKKRSGTYSNNFV